MMPMNLSVDDAVKLALKYQQAGQFEQAENIYAQVLLAVPNHFDALHLSAMLAHARGQFDSALGFINRAMDVKVAASAHITRGNVLLSMQRARDAIEMFRLALGIEPRNLKAALRLVVALRELGEFPEAIALLESLACEQRGGEDVQRTLGDTLLKAGRPAEAEAAFRRTLHALPNDLGALNNLGAALHRQGRNDEAASVLASAVKFHPGDVGLLCNLALFLQDQGRHSDAEPVLRDALRLQPDNLLAQANLAVALLNQGQLEEALSLARQALASTTDAADVLSTLLYVMSFDGDFAPESFLLLARRLGTQISAKARPMREWRAIKRPGSTAGTLRVGMVSGDLRAHPVSYFLENFIQYIDPLRVQLVAYASRPVKDEVSARLRAHFAEWHDISMLDDEAAAEKIEADAIHVLIDLSGHTSFNRLPLFAWKPAPVLASWLGFSTTTGVPAIDWLLADRVSVPDGEDHLYSERPWRLPVTRICLTPPACSDAPSPLPAKRNGYVTFGSFHSMSKISDRMLELWAQIISAVPDSVLRVQNAELNTPAARAAFSVRLQKAGLAIPRVQLAGAMPREEYLAAHAKVDIILDVFPYNGGTTTCEALWMGVPTLTLAGRTLISRYGATMLSACGLNEWIARDSADYVRRGIALAADLDALSDVRATLREKMQQSPLANGELFARQFEDAMLGMWLAWPGHAAR